MLRGHTLFIIHKGWPAHRQGGYPDGGGSRSNAMRQKLSPFEPETRGPEIVHSRVPGSFRQSVDPRQQRLIGIHVKFPRRAVACRLVGRRSTSCLSSCCGCGPSASCSSARSTRSYRVSPVRHRGDGRAAARQGEPAAHTHPERPKPEMARGEPQCWRETAAGIWTGTGAAPDPSARRRRQRPEGARADRRWPNSRSASGRQAPGPHRHPGKTVRAWRGGRGAVQHARAHHHDADLSDCRTSMFLSEARSPPCCQGIGSILLQPTLGGYHLLRVVPGNAGSSGPAPSGPWRGRRRWASPANRCGRASGPGTGSCPGRRR